MKKYFYQIREEGYSQWDEIPPFAMLAANYDQAANYAKSMAAANGREVRMTEAGSYQGHYFRP